MDSFTSLHTVYRFTSLQGDVSPDAPPSQLALRPDQAQAQRGRLRLTGASTADLSRVQGRGQEGSSPKEFAPSDGTAGRPPRPLRCPLTQASESLDSGIPEAQAPASDDLVSRRLTTPRDHLHTLKDRLWRSPPLNTRLFGTRLP